MSGVRVALGGTAVVFCVHDRAKRRVTSEEQLVNLLRMQGEVFDPRRDRIHRCGCCDNLFAYPSAEPRYCTICSGAFVHALGGPLATPIGEVDG